MQTLFALPDHVRQFNCNVFLPIFLCLIGQKDELLGFRGSGSEDRAESGYDHGVHLFNLPSECDPLSLGGFLLYLSHRILPPSHGHAVHFLLDILRFVSARCYYSAQKCFHNT